MKTYEFNQDTRSFLESLPIPLAVYQYIDDKIKALLVSNAYLKLFGYGSCEEAVYCLNSDLFRNVHPDDIAEMEESAFDFATSKDSYNVCFRNMRDDQTSYHLIRGTGRYITINDHRLGFITYTDETDQAGSDEIVQAVLTSLAEFPASGGTSGSTAYARHFDELTGLHNMTHFLKNAGTGIQNLWEQGRSPVILYFDLKDLKLYNSRYGFKVGDEQICRLAGQIEQSFGMESTSRFESDHFVAYADGEHIEKKLRDLFSRMKGSKNGDSLPVKVGIYKCMNDGTGLATACDNAKLACSSISQNTNSEFAYFEEGLLEEAHFKNYIMQNFDAAVKNGWLTVYYQPVVRAMTSTVCGGEALVRWIDPEYGMIMPGRFIPILEETGQIFGLDLYVFEHVCMDHCTLKESGEDVVPVSVNLSRKDFLHDDLVEKLDAISRKYGVPREFTNLEITESAFVGDIDRVGEHIRRLHELGYHVWMDDFGSGYSSLSVLKNFAFDELKIDMSFLRNFDEKSKKIITSIVRMAKEIGIQTLAEGVETEEQFFFLKNAGCEIIQGYYFSKPMPLDETIPFFQKRGIELEEVKWKNYLNAISRIDYLTDRPLCVVDDDGTNIDILFANEAYMNVLRRDSVDDIKEWEKKINTPNDPVHTFHRQYMDQQLRRLEGPQVLAYPSGDHYMQLTGSVVAREDEHYLYTVHIQYVEINAESLQQSSAEAVNELYYLCSDIAMFDFERNTVEGLKSSMSGQPMGLGTTVVGMGTVVDKWTHQYCYLPDQKRFEEFMDLSTLRERLRNNRDHTLTGFFRSRVHTGEYRWLFHIIIPVERTDFAQALHFTIETGLDEGKIKDMVSSLSGTGHDDEGDGITGEVLWKNLLRNSFQMFFWKDDKLRFKGASNSFIEYFGHESVNDIIGKTDDEIKCHLDPAPYRVQEEEILRSGKGEPLNIEKFVIDGVGHDVLTIKLPVFRDGKVIGLMGCCWDFEEATTYLKEKNRIAYTDPVTGLASARGLTDSLYIYLRELCRGHADVALLEIRVPEYDEVTELYGDESGDELLNEVGLALRRVTGRNIIAGRTDRSRFCVLMNYHSKDEIRDVAGRIRREIESIRKAGDWSGDCSAIVTAACTSESQGTFLTDTLAGIYKVDDLTE